jgi:Heterokaryon incompatibility protein (HET)
MVLFTRAFFYQPLDENIGEIRLLRLLRRHDSRLPFLRRSRLCEAECETRHFRLGHAPRYTALSYCWGSPMRKNTIPLNDGCLPITRNLSEYTKHSTPNPSEGPSRYLWIDAICIDQDNLVERSKQILRMKQIYEQAESIDIWLGLGDDQTDVFLDRVNRIIEKSRDDPQHSSNLDDILLPFLQSLSLNSWDPMGKLLSNPWWTRAWVIQEATTSGNDVSVLCGHRRISFNVVNHIFEFLVDKGTIPRRIFKTAKWLSVAMLSTTRHMPEAEEGPWKDRFDLCWLWEEAKGHDAEDPRDKVYSVLALANDGGESDLQLDYTLSIREVYVSTARHILNRRKDLRLLYSCFHWDELDGLPSWVPDWRKRLDAEPLSFVGVNMVSLYRASNRPLTILDFKDYPEDRCALLIEGSIVGEVSLIGICRRPGDIRDDDCAKNWAQMALFTDSGDVNLDLGTLLETFARTICADIRDRQHGEKLQRGCSSKWPEPDAEGKYPENCFKMSMCQCRFTGSVIEFIWGVN